MSQGRRWSDRRRRGKENPEETRTGDNRKSSTEENETPHVRTTDLCEQDATGSTDQKDLGGAVLWKGAADLSESVIIFTKQIGLLDPEKWRKQENEMTQKLCVLLSRK